MRLALGSLWRLHLRVSRWLDTTHSSLICHFATAVGRELSQNAYNLSGPMIGLPRVRLVEIRGSNQRDAATTPPCLIDSMLEETEAGLCPGCYLVLVWRQIDSGLGVALHRILPAATVWLAGIS
ncbi:uncharacterized protein P884DRAFT_261245 [Thermothelomyces heterothallicus CBS 202.75]|uniref:uncharacterized protein n=1 Tax=Thermothelomyces heterothallicus CBS 202.75 TaxID=1149848 RepID=UPI0037424527